jgi:hypothetical protein
LDPDALVDGIDLHTPIARVRQGMKVAVVDEGFQLDIDGTTRAKKRVLDVRGVLALAHPDAFFEESIGEGVSPGGHAAFEIKTFEVSETFRIDSPTGPAMRCERKISARVVDDFVKRRDQLRAADRRLKRSDQQTVIAAREAASDGTGGVSA